MEGEPPQECTTAVVEKAVATHLASPSMWCILPIQDLLGMDAKLRRPIAAEEQINDPANNMHYWRFRLHVPIETILESTEFLKKLADLNRASGRG
mmetsp:Transcript_11807/g.24068  ORF Transcript_11807/g.24068 Transcript_11807/m.24068 type:complete len:95 (+) Transcript_11807:2320-2604(+)